MKGLLDLSPLLVAVIVTLIALALIFLVLTGKLGEIPQFELGG